MMVCGTTELKMGMEFGKESTMTVILENGRLQKLMAMVSTFGKMATGTKENGIIVLNMVKGQIFLLMATLSQELTDTENQKVGANTNGITAQCMSASLRKV